MIPLFITTFYFQQQPLERDFSIYHQLDITILYCNDKLYKFTVNISHATIERKKEL